MMLRRLLAFARSRNDLPELRAQPMQNDSSSIPASPQLLTSIRTRRH